METEGKPAWPAEERKDPRMKRGVYSVEETAEKFDVNVKTIYEGVAKKEIPKVPGLGRAIKIPAAWVDAKLDGGKAA